MISSHGCGGCWSVSRGEGSGDPPCPSLGPPCPSLGGNCRLGVLRGVCQGAVTPWAGLLGVEVAQELAALESCAGVGSSSGARLTAAFRGGLPGSPDHCPMCLMNYLGCCTHCLDVDTEPGGGGLRSQGWNTAITYRSVHLGPFSSMWGPQVRGPQRFRPPQGKVHPSRQCGDWSALPRSP